MTGRPDPEPDVPWREALVRVVTGALDGAPTAGCDPLVRVLTVPATAAVEPVACDPLAPVCAAGAFEGTDTWPWKGLAPAGCTCLTM